MKIITYGVALLCLLPIGFYVARGGGGHGGGGGRGGGGGHHGGGGGGHHGGGGGGHHKGGGGGHHRGSGGGGHHKSGGGGGHHQGRGHGKGGGHHRGGHHGRWNHHGGHGHHGWNGNRWNGPYYYGGWWWGSTGVFLVGLTFYTCTTAAIRNTNTWIIYNGDTTVYQNWPDDADDLTIMQVEDDPDGYDYRICNSDGSCVRAKPASSD